MTTITKFRRILTKSEIKQLIFLSLGTIILSVSEAFGIGIIIPILNLCMNPGRIPYSLALEFLYKTMGTRDPMTALTVLIVTGIILFIIKAVYAVYINFKQQQFSYDVLSRLTTSILRSYLQKRYTFHLENNSSVLFKNISAEAGLFTSGFLTPVILISSEIIIIAGIFLLLIWVYPLMTSSLVAIFAFIVLMMNLIFKKKISAYSMARHKYSEHIHKNALEALQAVKEIQVYNVSGFFVDKFHQATNKYAESYLKFTVISGLPRYIFETALFCTTLIFLLFNIYYKQNFLELIPMMMVIGIAALKLLPSINKIYTNFNLAHFSLKSLDVVYGILNDVDDIAQSSLLPSGSEEVMDSGAVCLKDITFSYKSAVRPIFENFNLSIPLNHTIAFVGTTGAGKSTLVDIIMGLLIPAKGAIYYKGELITEANTLDYRRRIGYVPQQILLLDNTIDANIAFGVPPACIDSKRIESVIKISQLESFVDSLPEKIKTEVGERGVRISGGQRQRIGIARALYRNPEILILDEATSSLDGRTEADVARAINELSGKITMIIIAHRLSTIKNADIIFVLDSGRVVAQGNFKELSEKSTAFKNITDHSSSLVEDGQGIKEEF